MTKTQNDKTANKKTQVSVPDDADVVANEVRLVGRLTGAPSFVELPSGDALVTFRISVPRAAPSSGGTSAPPPGRRVDSVPCTAWSPRLRRSILTWRTGDLVEVAGAVRCRFYQAGGATRSRVEIEVSSARIMRRAPAA
ncbi:hypothetical protein GCM10023339_41860 [Alloalcanivorax gelatiniphagus]